MLSAQPPQNVGAADTPSETLMKKGIFLAFVILSSSAFWAADQLQPPDLKTGLWETTMIHSPVAGLAMPTIPPEALAKLTPEQRARMEEMMKNKGTSPTTTTTKSCITKEKLEKDLAFRDERSQCTHTVLSSSGRGFEVKLHCTEKDSTSDGTFKLEVINPESAKGALHMVVSGNGQNMKVDSTFTSRYLGPSCGDMK
jgi:Protein of unknown function (DUF3617)